MITLQALVLGETFAGVLVHIGCENFVRVLGSKINLAIPRKLRIVFYYHGTLIDSNRLVRLS